MPHVHRQVEGLAHRQVKLQRLHFRGRVVRIAIGQGLKLISRFKIDNRDEVALGRNIERVTRRDQQGFAFCFTVCPNTFQLEAVNRLVGALMSGENRSGEGFAAFFGFAPDHVTDFERLNGAVAVGGRDFGACRKAARLFVFCQHDFIASGSK
ncbi:hypothetical protein BK651_09340 [Pseudomonas rhodesiae]|nr:hypothetical protein BK650_18165 [Pseudomonas rhodesiae]ROM66265.1 hypothetical protein BK651_09340 [Pseudomonas rhodesiae]